MFNYVSPGLKDVITQRFNKHANYIPNIVDTKLFTYTPRKKDNIFRFVSIGSLKIGKRMDLTIEAFVRAFNDNDNVTLTIFGEGPERPKLKKLIEKYQVEDKIKLMGLQSRKDIAEFLKKSDCFVLASQMRLLALFILKL